jgi:hypothetical protein
VVGLLPPLFCIGGGAVLFVPHTSPFAVRAIFLLAFLGALYWLVTGLKQARDQHRVWYKQSGVLVGLGYLLALPEFWFITTTPTNALTIEIIGEIALFLIIVILFVVASYARRQSEPGPVDDRRRESLFSRKTPPFT